MSQNPGILLTIIAFILVIGPLVFVHEFGHYLAGRLFGVKAEAFSIGFGREIFGHTDKRGTRWKFGWLPLGGYVRFAGDMGVASEPSADWLALPPAERAQTFPSKPVWQRAIIVAAGPVTNFIVAILILAGFAFAYGDVRTPATVGSVMPGSAAQAAGLRAGDRIVSINGRSFDRFENLARYIAIRPRAPAQIQVVRAGQPVALAATFGAVKEGDRFGNTFEIGQLGIGPSEPVFATVSLVEAPVVGVRRTGELVRMMADTIGQVITGRRSLKDFHGPVGTAQIAGEQMTLGLDAFVALIAVVSINLGFINLLPVPMLDGGHLFFYAIEAVRRRPLGAAAQEWAFRGGLAAILALIVVVTFNDLGAFGLWKNLAGLIG
ncbi:RIP metalloprotease [Sphingomonas koreensis]|nr:RIP metalloprotease [Sphingomonas koreensis]